VAKNIQIVDGHGGDCVPSVRELFREYSDWLGVDLCFQNFETELASLPGKYAPPAGAILLAYVDSTLAGCVAMRPLAPSVCEMKRLWVRESFRGLGLGRRLVKGIEDRARSAGYGHMRLDTLPRMQEAQALYREMGFYEVAAYYATPIQGTVFLEKRI
jgi:putative acetyltransferase